MSAQPEGPSVFVESATKNSLGQFDQVTLVASGSSKGAHNSVDLHSCGKIEMNNMLISQEPNNVQVLYDADLHYSGDGHDHTVLSMSEEQTSYTVYAIVATAFVAMASAFVFLSKRKNAESSSYPESDLTERLLA